MLKVKDKEEYATYEEFNEIVNISMQLERENAKLQSQIDEVKEWCEKHKEYCFKEKDKDYIDELGAYQLLGSYLTCETIISKLEEVGK